jgi:osmotically inducible protein OsmC
MMPIRTSDAEWQGTLREGSGKMRFGSGAYEGAYTWSSRFEEAKGTNPEELIAAAHAGCYSMQFSGLLTKAGKPPASIRTTAKVEIIAGSGITSIALETVAEVPGIDEKTFLEIAEMARETCPVSKALKAVPITLNATLKK